MGSIGADTASLEAAGLESYELYVREGAPQEFEYLLLFTLGQIEYFTGNNDRALALFDESVVMVEGMSEARQQALAAPALYFYRGFSRFNLGSIEQAIL
jgi:hypothetical protein